MEFKITPKKPEQIKKEQVRRALDPDSVKNSGSKEGCQFEFLGASRQIEINNSDIVWNRKAEYTTAQLVAILKDFGGEPTVELTANSGILNVHAYCFLKDGLTFRQDELTKLFDLIHKTDELYISYNKKEQAICVEFISAVATYPD